MRTTTALPLLALMALLLQTSCTSTYYRGPVSDHFDGSRFHNPGKPDTKTRWDLLRWYWTRERGPWPEFSPLPTTDTPPARVEGETLRLSYVGHVSVLLQTRQPGLRLSALQGSLQRRIAPQRVVVDQLIHQVVPVALCHGCSPDAMAPF